MKQIFISVGVALVILLTTCSAKERTLETTFLQEGTIHKKTIPLDFLTSTGEISTPHIDSVKFCILDSLSYPNMNPDRTKIYTTPVKLDFSKKIAPYSPEYYTAYTIHYINKAIDAYNRLFDNKINFDFYREYRNIEVCFGDFSGITTPKYYVLEKNSHPSPSLFYHEIGHRAFWYIEDSKGLNVKFGGLTVIHMGLLEYFTLSFNNSPVMGEDCLPGMMSRDARVMLKYPLDDSLKLRRTLKILELSYPEEVKNHASNVAKYLAASYASYNSAILDNIYDNHRGGMVLTSTLWRIRQVAGREATDQLVAQTILNLNACMNTRENWCDKDLKASLKNRIEWCDVFYGLIQQDQIQNKGKNIQAIVGEFRKTGYPVDLIKVD